METKDLIRSINNFEQILFSIKIEAIESLQMDNHLSFLRQ